MSNTPLWAMSLQILLLLLLPALVLKAAKHLKIVQLLSPVLVCYLSGIALANQETIPLSFDIAMIVRNATVALAIPLLLYSVDIIGWLRLSRATVISFALCVFSVMLTSAISHFMYHDTFDNSAKIAGMMVGVYTGGTPNMNAIGTALGIEPEMFIVLESVDMIMGAMYLMFLLSFGPRLFAYILPPFKNAQGVENELNDQLPVSEVLFKHVMISLGLTIVVVALGGGLGMLLPKTFQEAGAILLITTFAIICSLNPKVRNLKGSHESGMYVLLIFCVAVGSCAKFETLVNTSPAIFGFIGFAMFGAVVLHLLLSKLFKIDRDTVIITSAAGIFGPAFIGPIAQALNNREIFFSGIATGLVGYAIGNYLGLALAWMLGG